MLSLGAGLFVSSVERLRSLDRGFQKESLLEIVLNPNPGGYDKLDMSSYHKQLLERISSLPGVRSASFSDAAIPSPEAWHDTVSAASTDPSVGTHLMANAETVSPGFFQTLGILLLRVRDFSKTADEKHPRLAFVNSSLSARNFPAGPVLATTHPIVI